jgi:hypothetical protein
MSASAILFDEIFEVRKMEDKKFDRGTVFLHVLDFASYFSREATSKTKMQHCVHLNILSLFLCSNVLWLSHSLALRLRERRPQHVDDH